MPLRPLGVGELLEGALSFIRSDPRTILGLAAILALGVAVIQTVGLWASLSALGPVVDDFVAGLPAELSFEMSQLLTASLAQVVPGIVTVLFQVVASGLFTVLVGAAVLGRSLDASRTWGLLRARLAPLLGLTLLLVVGGLAVIALSAGLVVVAGDGARAGCGGGAGRCSRSAVFVGALVVYVRIAVAAPALVLEGVGPVVALRRSWVLVQGSWWRVLGVLLLSGLITSLLTAVVSVPVGVAVSALAGFEPSLLASAIASGITGVIAGIVTWPFTAAVTGLLYVDLRMRRERLDLPLVAAAGQPIGTADPLAPYRLP